MNRWREINIRRLGRSRCPPEQQDTLSDSSDDESIISPLYDDFCSDEGSSYSESEPLLLELVKSENPSIDKARHLLSDLTAADISKAIEQKDTIGNSVIHYACAKALVPWVELLIDNKADLNVKGKDRQTPMHFAVKGEDKSVSQVKDKIKVVELLGKEQVHADEKDYRGCTPLQLACDVKGQREVTLALLSHTQIDVNQESKSGAVTSPLLHITCQNDQFENAMLLLKHGADPLAKDSLRGDTPFHIILRKGQVKFALRFLDICNQKGHDMREILLARNAFQQCVLHEAVKCGDIKLVKYCMERVSQSDDHDHLLEIKSKNDSTLMHTACRHGHYEIVQMLDKNCHKLLECQNKKGLTALHAACSRNHAKVTELVCDLLHQRRDEDIHNVMEESHPEDPPSLLKYAAKKDAIDCLVVLLKRQDQPTLFRFLKWISVEENLFKVFQALLNRYEEIKINKGQREIMQLTRLCAEEGKTESLLELVAWDKHIINNAYGYGNSLLHLMARNGHHQTTKAILKNPDVQMKKKNVKGQTALHVAIKEGHIMTSALILKTDKGLAEIKDDNKMTPLMYACQTGSIHIVELLLYMLQMDKVKIGFLLCDVNGLNCLDHAIDNGHERIAVMLLHDDDWRSLMTHASGSGRTKTTPMRKLIISMPGVCKFVLDKCIEPEDKAADIQHEDVEIRVDYELLDDGYSEWMREDSDSAKRYNSRSYMEMTNRSPESRDNYTEDYEQVSSNFRPNGKLKCDAKIQLRDRFSRFCNHPVKLMMTNDKSKELLNHPLVRLMLDNKHILYVRQYLPRLFLRLTLLLFLTLHSLIVPPPYYVKKHLSGGNYTWLADGETKWKKNLNPTALVLFGSIGTWLILVLTVIYFFECLWRKWVYRKTELSSIAGWLSSFRELTLQILIILFVIPGFGDLYFGHGVTFKADWQWELGAYAVLLAWINFILFLKTAPFVGIYIIMFSDVISTMVSFLFFAGIFICTFAVVFCILIINQAQYHTFGDSLAKSLAMLTGEIDFDIVFHPTDYLYRQSATEDFTNIVFYPNTTRVIFFIYLFFMPIVVMNLLTGLAVVDIDVIRKKKQIIEVETILAMQIFKLDKTVFRHQTIRVFNTVSFLRTIYYKLIGYTDTYDSLVALLEKLNKTKWFVVYTKTTDKKIDDMVGGIEDNIQQLQMRMQVIQDKLDKMCRDKLV